MAPKSDKSDSLEESLARFIRDDMVVCEIEVVEEKEEGNGAGNVLITNARMKIS